MVRNQFILFFLVTASANCFAQSDVDSLKNLLAKTELAETLRVDVLNKLAWNLKHNTPLQSLKYAEEALELSRKIKYIKGEGEAYNELGINYAITGEYPKSLENFLKALPIWDSTGDMSLKANTLNNIGNVHQLQGNIMNAKKFFQQGLRVRIQLKDTASIYASYNSLASVYEEQGQFDSALIFFRNFMRLAEVRKDIKRISTASNNIGLIHRNQKKYDSAMLFFNKALDIKRQIKDEAGIALTYRNIGDVFSEQGSIEKAIAYYERSLDIRERIGYNLGLTVLLKDIASMMLRAARYPEAERYAQRSLEVARKSKMKLEELAALSVLSETKEKQGNYKQSLAYHREYVALKDSLFNAEKSKQLSELQVQYETEQKAKELLAKSKAIELLEIQNSGNKKIKIVLFLASILLAAMVGLIYNRYLLKKSSEREVSRNSRVIEQKNQKIEEMNRELEKRMLRAQMDPHFIFNCLGSILHFLTVSDKDSAIKYLSKFSKLIRQILENSVNTIVPLADEIRLLELYIELEKLRYDHKFDYTIEIDPALDLQNVDVPFLLIQPYVENAIQHGLFHREAGGKLSIRLIQNEESIQCTIEDNGVGRRQASDLKSTVRNGHPPRGMSLTEQRLALLNNKQSRKTMVHVVDLDDDQNTGTKVTITIPNEYDEK